MMETPVALPHTPNERGLRRGEWPAVAALVFGLGMTFIYFGKFAYLDDMLQTAEVTWGPFSLWSNLIMAEGRPLFAFIVLGAWKLIGTVDHSYWLRLAGVVGAILTALSLMRFLRRETGMNAWLAASAGVLAVTTPSFAIYTFWATTSPFAWGAALATWCGGWVFSALREPRRQWLIVVGGTMGALAAEMIYQPVAGFFVLPALMALVVRPSRETVWRAGGVVLLFGVVLVLYLVLFKLSGALFFADDWHAGRGGDLGRLPAILKFFVLRYLPFLGEWWMTLIGGHWAKGAAVLVGLGWVAAGIVLLKRIGLGWGMLAVALLFAGLLQTEGPILGSGTYAPYRTQSASHALIYLIAACGIFRCLPRAPRLRWMAAVGVAVLAAGTTRYLTVRTTVDPLRAEYAAIEGFVDEHFPVVPEMVTLIPPDPPRRWLGSLRAIYEYGRFNSVDAHTMTILFKGILTARLKLQAKDENRDDFQELMVIEVLDAEKSPPWYHGVLVDCRELLGQPIARPFRPDSEAPREVMEHPVLGRIETTPSGWAWHSQLGWVRPTGSLWFQIPGIGWSYVYGPLKEDSYWLNNKRMGLFYGSLAEWPRATHYESREIVDLRALGRAKLDALLPEAD